MANRHAVVTVLLSTLVTLTAATSASAQSPRPFTFGVRGGLSEGPDGPFIGAQVETAPLLTGLTFRPNVEMVFEEFEDLLSANLEFLYTMAIPNSSWSTYAGGGVSANWSFFEDDSDRDGGVDLFVGLKHNSGLFGEVKVGNGGSASMKLTIGFSFR